MRVLEIDSRLPDPFAHGISRVSCGPDRVLWLHKIPIVPQFCGSYRTQFSGITKQSSIILFGDLWSSSLIYRITAEVAIKVYGCPRVSVMGVGDPKGIKAISRWSRKRTANKINESRLLIL
jgi:hypothetical protein